MALDWMNNLLAEFTVSEGEYSEYLRLEVRKRALEEELKSIEKQQQGIKGKVLSVWERDNKKNYKLGDRATFFVKRNLVVLPLLGVEEDDVVAALYQCGYDRLINSCVDWQALRAEVRKLEGELPEELKGLLKVWVKKDLYLRINKPKE